MRAGHLARRFGSRGAPASLSFVVSRSHAYGPASCHPSSAAATFARSAVVGSRSKRDCAADYDPVLLCANRSPPAANVMGYVGIDARGCGGSWFHLSPAYTAAVPPAALALARRHLGLRPISSGNGDHPPRGARPQVYLGAMIGWANKRPGADAGWRVLFAPVSPRPRAPQAERSAET